MLLAAPAMSTRILAAGIFILVAFALAGAAVPPREDAAATAAAAAICGSSTVHASPSAAHTGLSSSAKD